MQYIIPEYLKIYSAYFFQKQLKFKIEMGIADLIIN